MARRVLYVASVLLGSNHQVSAQFTNPPCYLCLGDPKATMSKPTTTLVIPPEFDPRVSEVSCQQVFQYAEMGALTEDLCMQVSSLDLVAATCGCSNFEATTSQAPAQVPARGTAPVTQDLQRTPQPTPAPAPTLEPIVYVDSSAFLVTYEDILVDEASKAWVHAATCNHLACKALVPLGAAGYTCDLLYTSMSSNSAKRRNLRSQKEPSTLPTTAVTAGTMHMTRYLAYSLVKVMTFRCQVMSMFPSKPRFSHRRWIAWLTT
jgi:hypothetical protein